MKHTEYSDTDVMAEKELVWHVTREYKMIMIMIKIMLIKIRIMTAKMMIVVATMKKISLIQFASKQRFEYKW